MTNSVHPGPEHGALARAGFAAFIGGVWLITIAIGLAHRLRWDFRDVMAPTFLVGVLVGSVVGAILWASARGRGLPHRWILLAFAWGLLPAIWIAQAAGATIDPAIADQTPGMLDRAVIGAVAVAPPVEELAKGLGILIVLGALRFGGYPFGIVTGAMVGGFVGLGFEIGELVEQVHTEIGNWTVDLIVPDNVYPVIASHAAAKFHLLGFDGHVLFSALFGVGVATAISGRRWAGVGWMAAAVAAHGLGNGTLILMGPWLFGLLAPSPFASMPMVIAVVIGVVTAVVSRGWAAWLLLRHLRRAPVLTPIGFRP
ncbi:MAG: PrsW family glutamic-type intramembrane protease [Chloroflexota bacterium]